MGDDLEQILTEVGPRLRLLREQHGSTLAGLSAATGISVSTLSRLESGQRRPNLELLLPLARAYGVPLDDLVGAPPTGDPRIHLRPFTYHGRHYDLVRPLNSPNSLQRPHPPILIGGSGERKTLRLVAKYGDACSLFDLPGSQFADNIEHKLAVLREHCAAEGRDYAEIEKTIASPFDQGDDPKAALPGLLAHLADLAALGIDHVLLSPRGPWDEPTLDALVSVIPDIHALETAGR